VVEFDFEGFAEFQGVPSMVFTRIMAWEIGRGDICDSFCVDADSLPES